MDWSPPEKNPHTDTEHANSSQTGSSRNPEMEPGTSCSEATVHALVAKSSQLEQHFLTLVVLWLDLDISGI